MINTDECWHYAGTMQGDGYGIIYATLNHKPIRQLAHRASYETFVGEIPEGLVIDHLCRVRCCINPEHLEPVTLRENTLRGDGVLYNLRKTHCKFGHAFTPENTTAVPKGRQCKACAKIRNRNFYLNNKIRWKTIYVK